MISVGSKIIYLLISLSWLRQKQRQRKKLSQRQKRSPENKVTFSQKDPTKWGLFLLRFERVLVRFLLQYYCVSLQAVIKNF